MRTARMVEAGTTHPDQVARAEYESGADLKSVVRSRPDSVWAWAALGHAAFDSGDAVAAYAYVCAAGRIGAAGAAEAADEARVQQVAPRTEQPLEVASRTGRAPAASQGQLLALVVAGLAAKALGLADQASRAKSELAALGYDSSDASALASLTSSPR